MIIQELIIKLNELDPYMDIKLADTVLGNVVYDIGEIKVSKTSYGKQTVVIKKLSAETIV